MCILIIRAELSRISQAYGWAGLERFGAGVGEPEWKPMSMLGGVMVKLFITLLLTRVFGLWKLGSLVVCRGGFRALGMEIGRRLGLSAAMVWLAGVLWLVVI